MKEAYLVLAFGCAVSISCFSIFVVGKVAGEHDERDRLYTKCLAEHETMPHKEAVALCKERVK